MDTTLPGPGPHWRPRAVVFDCDGVLMDTESAWARVQAQVAESFGVTIDEEEVDTVGGLIGKISGRVPIGGAHCEVAGLSLTAEKMSGRQHRIATVIVERVEPVDSRQSEHEEIGA